MLAAVLVVFFGEHPAGVPPAVLAGVAVLNGEHHRAFTLNAHQGVSLVLDLRWVCTGAPILDKATSICFDYLPRKAL